MPYANEHAARLVDPDRFDDFRRGNDKFGPGVHAIFGLKGGKSTLQAIRFDAAKFTPAQAKAWLKGHDYSPMEFAEATGKHGFFEVRAEICKIDEELRVVYGWAYVCEENGKPVVDHSGDVIPWREIEKCAHQFNLDSRRGGIMHKDSGGDIVANLMFSPDVQDALGIDLNKVGWFIGYRVNDDAAWQGVLKGKYTGFSIHGTALRRELDDGEAKVLGL